MIEIKAKGGIPTSSQSQSSFNHQCCYRAKPMENTVNGKTYPAIPFSRASHTQRQLAMKRRQRHNGMEARQWPTTATE